MGENMQSILQVTNLKKYYNKVKAVDGISFELFEGEVFGFIGPNGAGKSTTIKSIMNLVNKNDGEILFNGSVLEKDNINQKKLIGYLPSEVNLYDDMTIKQLFDYHQKFYPENEGIAQKRKYLTQKLVIDENKKIDDLSLGNLKKAGIVLAFMHSPKLVILDEPTSGLDPIIQREFFDIIKEEKSKGTTILYSTHILSEVSRLCDRATIIKNGKLVVTENIEDLKQKNLVFVKITSPQCDIIKQKINGEILLCENNNLTFIWKNDATHLIDLLSSFNITKLIIEEPSLDELFMHYYK